MKKEKILFVCKFNNARSQIAEYLFNKFNKNKRVRAFSAGIIGGLASKETRNNLSELGKKHKLKFSKKSQLTQKILYGSSIIIVVADDVPLSLFNSQKKSGIKVIKWNVKDGWKYKEKTQIERFERVYEDIFQRINALVKKLK